MAHQTDTAEEIIHSVRINAQPDQGFAPVADENDPEGWHPECDIYVGKPDMMWGVFSIGAYDDGACFFNTMEEALKDFVETPRLSWDNDLALKADDAITKGVIEIQAGAPYYAIDISDLDPDESGNLIIARRTA